MITDNDVLEMAKRECKGIATDAEITWLQQPENHFAWCQALITAVSDFDSQLLFHKTRVDMMSKDVELGIIPISVFSEEKQRFDEWIRKSTRYRNGITKRLSEVKTLLSQKKELDLIEEVARLTRCIIEHRRSSIEGEYGAEAHDLRLWSSVVMPD